MPVTTEINPKTKHAASGVRLLKQGSDTMGTLLLFIVRVGFSSLKRWFAGSDIAVSKGHNTLAAVLNN